MPVALPSGERKQFNGQPVPLLERKVLRRDAARWRQLRVCSPSQKKRGGVYVQALASLSVRVRFHVHRVMKQCHPVARDVDVEARVERRSQRVEVAELDGFERVHRSKANAGLATRTAPLCVKRGLLPGLGAA